MWVRVDLIRVRQDVLPHLHFAGSTLALAVVIALTLRPFALAILKSVSPLTTVWFFVSPAVNVVGADNGAGASLTVCETVFDAPVMLVSWGTS